MLPDELTARIFRELLSTTMGCFGLQLAGNNYRTRKFRVDDFAVDSRTPIATGMHSTIDSSGQLYLDVADFIPPAQITLTPAIDVVMVVMLNDVFNDEPTHFLSTNELARAVKQLALNRADTLGEFERGLPYAGA